MLWEVNLTVEGKRLSDLLEAVEGKIVNWNMRAIKGAELDPTRRPYNKRTKDVKEVEPVGGSMADKVAHIIKLSKQSTLSREELSKMIVDIGGNPSGISYYVANLRNAKIISKFDKETKTYSLLKRK